MDASPLYRQEGQFGIYQLTLCFLAVGPVMRRTISATYGRCWVYYHDGQGVLFLPEQAMEEISKVFFQRAANGFPLDWQEEWKKIDTDLTENSRVLAHLPIRDLSPQELWEHYQAHLEKHVAMWGMAIFIDGLDNGADQREMERVRLAYGFTPEEVQTLLAPLVPSYITEVEQALFAVKTGAQTAAAFVEKYFWWGTDYNHYREMDEAFVQEAAAQAHASPFVSPREAQQAILDAHHLSENPFAVFQTLAVWRDDRKRLNYTGLYGLSRLIAEGLQRQGLAKEWINDVLPKEIQSIFLGQIDRTILEERARVTVLMCTDGEGGYVTEQGAEADRRYAELEARVPQARTKELRGMVACRGQVVGIARVVARPDSPEGYAFRDGEILVTSMTRPDFLPLMKRAAAIVTNEGGISCHAAIVARELNIPCIIGTKHATQVLKDGDEVEVNADEGTVKILRHT